MSPAFEVQKAIYARLKPVLAALTPAVPIFDHVPQGQSYPFVQFVRAIETPNETLSDGIDDVEIALAVWSNFRGQEQVLLILAVIKASLNRADLALASGYSMVCLHERSDTARDQDGVTYTGTALYRATVVS